MKPESIIKARIAETIVALMLEKEGYKVINFGFGGLSSNLIQNNIIKVSKKKSTQRILTTPTFVVIDKNKEPHFVKIKFQASKKSGNVLWGIKQIEENWPGTIVLVVSTKEPYFLLLLQEREVADDNLTPLTQSETISVNKKAAKLYGELVKRFLCN